MGHPVAFFKSVTAEICSTNVAGTNAARTNVSWTKLIVTVAMSYFISVSLFSSLLNYLLSLERMSPYHFSGLVPGCWVGDWLENYFLSLKVIWWKINATLSL